MIHNTPQPFRIKPQAFLAGLFLIQCSLQSMIYDNRYWPLYPVRFLSYQSCPYATWYWGVRGVFIGADTSFLDDEAGEDEGSVFDLFGKYDELALNQSLLNAGVISQSLIRPDLQGLGTIPWDFLTKISLRGAAFETEGYIIPWLSVGGSLFVGHAQSHLNAMISPQITRMLGPGDLQELRQADVALHQALSLQPPCWSTLGFGDIDLYLKGRFFRDYWYKMHHFDCALRLGLYLPTAQKASLSNAVSLPLGGNGHLGIYGRFDLNILLNDLINAGFSLQCIKRLPRTLTQRMPINQEPTNYGALVAPARIDPGLTFVFNPYVQMGGLREGLGIYGAYNLVTHRQDTWCVSDEIMAQFTPNLELLQKRSRWGSDHFTVGIWYDFGYDCEKIWYKPIISVIVEIPWEGPVTQMVPKAHSVSLRIESQL